MALAIGTQFAHVNENKFKARDLRDLAPDKDDGPSENNICKGLACTHLGLAIRVVIQNGELVSYVEDLNRSPTSKWMLCYLLTFRNSDMGDRVPLFVNMIALIYMTFVTRYAFKQLFILDSYP
ncbi:hypothetical protein C8Q69DRAFT_445666 [Paecilomyces variotii]|uniref:Uncharacterized protein n=1 Tax=Byssochlamys spectabilis TaxID=264951 RepID=A0A443HSF4_BYSSP|nr:hypothetical protein C8Q69DRAFT_445666 [Paecilomyces variotii]RWQ94747.1 hypothetical protein C8Q69DRAFT_445666 [Paecilomyces variotii]